MAGFRLVNAIVDSEDKLVEKICSFRNDPLGFVYYAYPWGEKGGPLELEAPDEWQKDLLNTIRDSLESGVSDGEAIQLAVVSGHGIGKTCEVAWIVDWFISTRSHPQIVVTANTKSQLDTKTWREVSKWHNMSINKHWLPSS